MPKRTIAVIEDDAAIREVVVDALELEGFATVAAANFKDGHQAAVIGTCDLVLLDLVFPGGDGLELLRAIRAARPRLPVIITTARGREDDRVAGLRLGADDYVVKPFGIKELIARVEAVLRRSAERPLQVREVSFRGGVADLDQRTIRRDGHAPIELAEREVELLAYLANNPGRTIARNELLEQVWHLAPNRVRTRTVDMHIARLREKLGDAGDGLLIRTVRGKGYAFDPLGQP